MNNKRTILVTGLFMILPILSEAQYNPDSQDDISKVHKNEELKNVRRIISARTITISRNAKTPAT